MANITNFNISDAALYYQALNVLSSASMDLELADAEVRRRLITYIERRRALFSLPPLRSDMQSLGEKVRLELRQMGLVTTIENRVCLTTAANAIVEQLRTGKGREARLAVLGRLVETFENVAILCKAVTPPTGKTLYLPLPRSIAEEIEDDENETKVAPTDLASICEGWREWCLSEGRPDLVPAEFRERTEALIESSMDKRGFASKVRNAMAQLVLEAATSGGLERVAIYRTLRDRLSTTGALNSVIRSVSGKPLAIEAVFSCMHFGPPPSARDEWRPLRASIGARELWIHEAEPAVVEPAFLRALDDALKELKERAGYYRVYELRDRICEAIHLSQGMFDATFLHVYRTRPGFMTLGVDYEKITAKRLPIEVKDGTTSNMFNLVAFKETP